MARASKQARTRAQTSLDFGVMATIFFLFLAISIIVFSR